MSQTHSKRLDEELGELAGHASLCWEPKPTGVFNSTEAGIAVMKAKVAIIDLMKEMVPKEGGGPNALGWMMCREKMLDEIEKISEKT